MRGASPGNKIEAQDPAQTVPLALFMPDAQAPSMHHDCSHIMTLNGAKVLEIDNEVGSIEAGKTADLVVIEGNPVAEPEEIRNVTLVFKDGLGYDSPKLIESVEGVVGVR